MREGWEGEGWEGGEKDGGEEVKMTCPPIQLHLTNAPFIATPRLLLCTNKPHSTGYYGCSILGLFHMVKHARVP